MAVVLCVIGEGGSIDVDIDCIAGMLLYFLCVFCCMVCDCSECSECDCLVGV